MLQTLVIFGSSLLLGLLQQSEAVVFPNRGLQHLSGEKYELSRHLCKCSGYKCSCCLSVYKFNVCSGATIIEGTIDNDYSIQVNITINNAQILSENYPISKIPPLCIEEDGMGICAKLVLKKVENKFQVCSDYQVIMDNEVVRQDEMFCIKVPPRKHEVEWTNYGKFASMYSVRNLKYPSSIKGTQYISSSGEDISSGLGEEPSPCYNAINVNREILGYCTIIEILTKRCIRRVY